MPLIVAAFMLQFFKTIRPLQCFLKGALMKSILSALAVISFSFSAQAETPAFFELESAATKDHTNGCPEGSYDWAASNDNQYLSMRFYQFDIAAGISTPGGDQHAEKRCDLVGRIRIPAGWMVGIDSVSVSANARATDQNSRGYIENSYSTETSRRPALMIAQSFSGPFNDDFNLPGRLPRDQILYTACSTFDTEQRLYLNSILSGQTSGFGETAISNNRNARAIVHQYRFTWTRCDGDVPLPQEWAGSCRVVLETVWGQDYREFFGTARARSEREAIDAANQDGHFACEDFRANDNLYRCVTDTNHCFANRN